MQAQDLRGIFTIMPTPAVKGADLLDLADTVDYDETRRTVRFLVDGGADAIMTAGTFGESPTLTAAELNSFTECVVKEVGNAVPVFAGATASSTKETITRARDLADLGVNGFFLGRPMWCRADDSTIIGFYADVTSRVPNLPVIVYDNPEAFKGKLSPVVYEALAQMPSVIGSKYMALTAQYHADLAACGTELSIMPIDTDWYFARRWVGDVAAACWTGSGNCGMAPLTALRQSLAEQDDARAREITQQMRFATETLIPNGDFPEFSRYNIPLEKARFAAAGFLDPGPARPPYDRVPESYLAGAREAGRRWAELQQKYGQ
jgi:dihydrodipicolinate synthase/N-acetylneuraminate lyase